MHTVALVVFDQVPAFEMAVPCEVFGIDRSDMGVPNYRLIVCAAEEGSLRAKVGFGIEVPYGLSDLHEAQTVVVPAWRDIEETPPTTLLEALRRSYRRGSRKIAVSALVPPSASTSGGWWVSPRLIIARRLVGIRNATRPEADSPASRTPIPRTIRVLWSLVPPPETDGKVEAATLFRIELRLI